MADEEDEATLRDFQIDVVDRSRAVGINESYSAKRDHAARPYFDITGVFRRPRGGSPLEWILIYPTTSARFKSLCREFAREEVRPIAEHHDATATFPYDCRQEDGRSSVFSAYHFRKNTAVRERTR